jgi:hypothetical protein
MQSLGQSQYVGFLSVVVILLVVLGCFLFISFRSRLRKNVPLREDWSGDSTISASVTEWQLFRTQIVEEFLSFGGSQQIELLDEFSQSVAQANFKGKRGNCVLRSPACLIEVRPVRNSLSKTLEYHLGSSVVASLAVGTSVFDMGKSPLRFGERVINIELGRSALFTWTIAFKEEGRLVAKKKRLSRFGHQPEALALRTDLPPELKLILFHISQLNF